MIDISRQLRSRIIGAYWGNKVVSNIYLMKNPKLLLRRLRNLSDVDAIEIAGTALSHLRQDIQDFIVTRVGNAILVNTATLNITVEIYPENRHSIPEFIVTHESIHTYVKAHQAMAIFDCLRHKGYDCGYAGITSLIDAELAIEITNE